MSIQSDVEMLSIQALEYYARVHKLSEADTVHLFHKYQVSFHTPHALKHLKFEIRKEVRS